MSKDPAFLFYSSDFLTGVSDLTMEERGQFITLLCLQHQKGALSEKLMRLQCGGIPNADVLAKFRIDENGLYYNKRIEEEREKRQAHSDKQRLNAYKRWDKDKNKNNKTLYNGNAMAMPLENENENEIVIDNVIEIYPSFDDFWNLYDYKKNKPKSTTAWNKLKQKDKEAIMDYLPIYIRSTPEKAFRKHPTTFLNNRGWEDEITLKNETQQTNYDNLRRSITPALSVK